MYKVFILFLLGMVIGFGVSNLLFESSSNNMLGIVSQILILGQLLAISVRIFDEIKGTLK